jgi:1,4-dihydroxy-2-naphthoate octaprenyltransferase
MTNQPLILLYWRMARPLQLAAVALVYTWGVWLATTTWDAWQPLPHLIRLVVLLVVSVSIHYANEYADYDTDALTLRTPFSGGSGALHAAGASRETARRAAAATLAAGLAAALVAYLTGYLPGAALLLLLLGAAGGWMYSLPPLALAWRGWGEITNAGLGGMLLPIWGFAAQTGRIDGRLLLITLPFTLLVFTNLLAATWPDRLADAQVGKFTLATRWPPHRLRALYFLAVAGAYGTLWLTPEAWLPRPVVWAASLSWPLALWAGYVYTRHRSPFPSVLVMMVFLSLQIGGRLWLLSGA